MDKDMTVAYMAGYHKRDDQIKKLVEKIQFMEKDIAAMRSLAARAGDIEGMAIFLCELDYPTVGWKGTVESTREWWRERARTVSKWIRGE